MHLPETYLLDHGADLQALMQRADELLTDENTTISEKSFSDDLPHITYGNLTAELVIEDCKTDGVAIPSYKEAERLAAQQDKTFCEMQNGRLSASADLVAQYYMYDFAKANPGRPFLWSEGYSADAPLPYGTATLRAGTRMSPTTGEVTLQTVLIQGIDGQSESTAKEWDLIHYDGQLKRQLGILMLGNSIRDVSFTTRPETSPLVERCLEVLANGFDQYVSILGGNFENEEELTLLIHQLRKGHSTEDPAVLEQLLQDLRQEGLRQVQAIEFDLVMDGATKRPNVDELQLIRKALQ